CVTPCPDPRHRFGRGLGRSSAARLFEATLELLERLRARTERLVWERVQRDLRRLTETVQVGLVLADIEQPGHDLAGALPRADVIERRAAVARIIVAAHFAQQHAASVVQLDR